MQKKRRGVLNIVEWKKLRFKLVWKGIVLQIKKD